MSVCGIDYSSRAVDVVLLDEDTDAATWHRFDLREYMSASKNAFDRARDVKFVMPSSSFWDEVLAIGIEDPRGYGAGSLYRIQGAILACLPSATKVHPWVPSAWRKAVGLSGRASKDEIRSWVENRRWDYKAPWPQDACDAYCIALATRAAIQVTA
jgi:hypothetical protein